MSEGERKAQARARLAEARDARRARRKPQSDPAQPTFVERATWPAKEAWWATQDRFLWPLNDRVKETVERAGWRLEDARWGLKRTVVWPVTDRIPADDLLSRGSVRAAMGTAGVVAIAAVTAGALASSFDREPAESAERVALERVTISEPVIEARTEKAPSGPLLNGQQPVFRPTSNPKVIEKLRALREQRTLAAEESGNRAPGSSTDAAPAGNKPSKPGSENTGPAGNAGAEGASGAASAGTTVPDADQQPVPRAEWSPTAVSKLFASAFVLYEIGRGSEKTNQVFRTTAGKELREALAERPPRQPVGKRVPRAEVANVVEGRRDGKVLPVSVSLVRVSGVNELRLELRKTDGGWRVVSVRG